MMTTPSRRTFVHSTAAAVLGLGGVPAETLTGPLLLSHRIDTVPSRP